jgi:hypothetical protein
MLLLQASVKKGGAKGSTKVGTKGGKSKKKKKGSKKGKVEAVPMNPVDPDGGIVFGEW